MQMCKSLDRRPKVCLLITVNSCPKEECLIFHVEVPNNVYVKKKKYI